MQQPAFLLEGFVGAVIAVEVLTGFTSEEAIQPVLIYVLEIKADARLREVAHSIRREVSGLKQQFSAFDPKEILFVLAPVVLPHGRLDVLIQAVVTLQPFG